MSKYVIISILCLIFNVPSYSQSLMGRVINENGRPIQGARIFVFNSDEFEDIIDGKLYETPDKQTPVLYTDESGRFVYPSDNNNTEDLYNLIILDAGFLPKIFNNIEIKSHQDFKVHPVSDSIEHGQRNLAGLLLKFNLATNDSSQYSSSEIEIHIIINDDVNFLDLEMAKTSHTTELFSHFIPYSKKQVEPISFDFYLLYELKGYLIEINKYRIEKNEIIKSNETTLEKNFDISLGQLENSQIRYPYHGITNLDSTYIVFTSDSLKPNITNNNENEYSDIEMGYFQLHDAMKIIESEFYNSVIINAGSSNPKNPKNPKKYSYGKHLFTTDTLIITGDFYKPIDFSESHFTGSLLIKEATFHERVSFYKSIFLSNVRFQNVEFHDLVIFDLAQFGTNATIDSVLFDSVSFNRTMFPQGMIFKDISVAKDFDASNIYHNPCINYSKVTFLKSQCQNLDLIFDEYLDFEVPPDSTSKRDERANVYQMLLTRAKKEGYTKSYEIIDKKYREFEYLSMENKLLGKVLNWLHKNWWGYGYNKEYIILNTLYIFLFFALINCFILEKMSGDVYEYKGIKRLASDQEIIPIIKYIRRIPLSIYYTSIIFFVVSISIKKIKYEENLGGLRWRWLAYLGFIYISGLVCIGYLANFILSNGA